MAGEAAGMGQKTPLERPKRSGCHHREMVLRLLKVPIALGTYNDNTLFISIRAHCANLRSSLRKPVLLCPDCRIPSSTTSLVQQTNRIGPQISISDLDGNYNFDPLPVHWTYFCSHCSCSSCVVGCVPGRSDLMRLMILMI